MVRNLLEFRDYLNSVDENLKFTLEYSRESISFLDTLVHLKDGEIWTEVYTKPTDSQSYLHFQSAHPSHMKNSLPYSQFLRVKRICSKDNDFLRHSAILLAHFYVGGTPLNLYLKIGKRYKGSAGRKLWSLTLKN